METNLQAWMQQYADRFRAPNLAAAGAAQATGMQPGNSGAPALGNPQPAQNLATAAAPAATPESQTEAIPGDGMDDDSFQSHFMRQPEKEQASQIDELEQKVGSIDRAYQQMSQQLGQRPSTKLSRKEKGMLIMEFGLQLMSQSAAGAHGGDFGGAVGDAGLNTLKSYRNQKAGKQKQADQWDQDQINLRAAHNKEVGQATTEFRTEQRDQHREDMDQKRLDNEQRRLDQTDTRLKDLETYRDRQMDDREERTDRNLGAGTSGSGGKPTAAIQNIEYLVKNGMTRERATAIVHRQEKDPRKAYEDIYKSARQRYAKEGDAREEAKRITEVLYGPGALDKAQSPLIPEEGVQRRKSKKGEPMVSRDGGKTWDYED